MKKYILSYLLFFTSVITLYAQEYTLHGQVIDAQTREPLTGVNVVVTHTSHGTMTDILGEFTLTATQPIESVTFSFVGFETKTVQASEGLKAVKLNPSALELNQIIVSGSREKQARKDAPLAISSLSSQTIADTKANSLDQLLNQVSGVFMVSGANSNEQHSMSIRTPMSYKGLFLYLEDGLPIRPTGVFNHNALLEMNQTSIQNIEVIKGPASSIFGSEAIGGAINLLTRKPTQDLRAGISGQLDNLGYKRTDWQVSNTFGKAGFALSGYYADRTDGLIEHSDFNKLALTLRTDVLLGDRLKWITVADLIDYRSDMGGSLDSAKFYGGNYESSQTFTNREVDAFRLRTTLEQYWNDRQKTSATIFTRTNSIRQNPSYRIKDDFKPWLPAGAQGDPNKAYGEVNNNSFESYGTLVQHKITLDFWNMVAIGGVYLDYSPNTYQANFINVVKSDEGVYTAFEKTDSLLAKYTTGLLNIATYAQVEFNPIERLKVVAALRYDRFVYDYQNSLTTEAFSGVPDTKNIFENVSPKIGATYDFGNNTGVYANYSIGFVPPQITELYRGTNVPRLEPSDYENYEVGGWFTLWKNKVAVEYSLYQLEGKNTIISVMQDDGSRENQNAGKTRSRGIESGITFTPVASLSLRYSATYAEHRFVDFVENGNNYSNSWMDAAPKWISNTMLTYRPAFLKGLRMSLEWQHMSQYYMSPRAQEATETSKIYQGFDVINFRTGYTRKAWDIWLNVLNVTDTLYATRASASQWGESYSIGLPLTWNIGLGYTFGK